MVYLISLLLLVGCYGSVAQVEATPSSTLVKSVQEGQLSFGTAFRRLAKTSDLGGLYRLLWGVGPFHQNDRAEIYQLLLSEQEDERELARKAYPLLRTILKMAGDGGETPPREASLRIELLVTENLAGALHNFAQELQLWRETMSPKELKTWRQQTRSRLAYLETAYREFEYLYANLGQDDYVASRQLRRAIRYRIGIVITSIDGRLVNTDEDRLNPRVALSKIFDEFVGRIDDKEALGKDVELIQDDFDNFLRYVEKSTIWWNH